MTTWFTKLISTWITKLKFAGWDSSVYSWDDLTCTWDAISDDGWHTKNSVSWFVKN